jgi:hypothetical protein
MLVDVPAALTAGSLLKEGAYPAAGLPAMPLVTSVLPSATTSSTSKSLKLLPRDGRRLLIVEPTDEGRLKSPWFTLNGTEKEEFSRLVFVLRAEKLPLLLVVLIADWGLLPLSW